MLSDGIQSPTADLYRSVIAGALVSVADFDSLRAIIEMGVAWIKVNRKEFQAMAYQHYQ